MCETQQIEHYVLNTLPHEEKLLMDAKLLLDKDLNERLLLQKQTYAMVQQYGRKLLRAEIENVHGMMFSESKFQNFRKKIFNIFKK
jgi:hypothetical protein